MRTLVYKRTHPGDPDAEGRFGIHDCMGQVRWWSFEAVIGVGGTGDEPESHGIAGKVNWIGIGPRKARQPGKRGPLVTFDHFLYFEAEGPDFLSVAPTLATRMYSNNVRFVMDDLDAAEQAEVENLLGRAKSALPSRAAGSRADGAATEGSSTRDGATRSPTVRKNFCGCGERAPAPKKVKGCSS